MSASRTILVALALAVAPAAWAQSVPAVEFKGIALGTTESRLRESFPFFRCGASADQAMADRTCSLDATTRDPAAAAFADAGGVTIRAAVASFIDDRLVQLTIGYDPADYPRLEEAMTAKFGSPTVKDVSVINRRGATIPNAVARWSFPAGNVENRRYGSTLERALLTLSVTDYVNLTQRRQLEAVKANAKVQ